jgi:hypothetical protein
LGVVLSSGALLLESAAGLRAGLLVLGAGVLLFEANMVRVYGHLRFAPAHPATTTMAVDQPTDAEAPGRRTR